MAVVPKQVVECKGEMMENAPKLCVLAANPVRSDLANGVMINSLFRQWPSEQLSHIYFRTFSSLAPDCFAESNCRSLSIFGGRARDVVNRTGSVTDGRVGPNAKHHRANSGALSGLWGCCGPLIKRRKDALALARAVQELCALSGGASRGLRKMLRQERPDVVYAHIGSNWISQVVCRACRQEGIPLVIHVTDDYVDGLYSEDVIGRWLSRAAEHSLKEVSGYASKCIAISPMMASDFATRYEQAWDWCTTLVRDSEVPRGATSREESEDAAFRLVYAGSLELNRWVALRCLANFISENPKIGNKSLFLDIWCKDEDRLRYQEKLSVGSGAIRFRGWLERDKLRGFLAKADLCVHAESSFEEDVRFTRLSLSTKISQYLVLGKPVLALAPRAIASVKVLEAAGACVGVCDSGEGELDAILRRCVYDRGFLAQCGRSGQNWAKTSLNVDVRGRRILKEIASIGNRIGKT